MLFTKNDGIYETVLFHRAPWFCAGAFKPSDNCPLLPILAADLCDCMKSHIGENFKGVSLKHVVLIKSKPKDPSVLRPGFPDFSHLQI